MSPDELRELIANMHVDERDPSAVSIAISQYETALHTVLDELDKPVGAADESIVLLNRYRVCTDLAHALGVTA